MTQQFVRVLADVHCDCAPDQRPIYRLYVDDELFTERTWIWQNVYLEEVIPILAEPGDYVIRYELVPGTTAGLNIQNLRVAEGSATIQDATLRIR
jgi:hypothetical protein